MYLKHVFLIGFFLSLFTVQSCKKDDISAISQDLSEQGSHNGQGSRKVASISEAKAYFYDQRRNLRNGSIATRSDDPASENENLTPFDFDPDWSYSRNILFAGQLDMLAVPVRDSLAEEYMPGSIRNMLFFRDSTDNLHVRLMVLVAEPGYASSVNQQYSTQNFTGITFQLNEEGLVGVFNVINNGEITHCIEVIEEGEETTIGDRGWPPKWWPFGQPRCPSPSGRKHFFKDLFTTIVGILEGIFGGTGTGGGIDDTTVYYQDGYFGIAISQDDWNTAFNGNSGGTNFSYYFQDDIFFDNIFHLQVAECIDLFSAQDPPLIYLTTGHYDDWDDQFLHATNFYLEQLFNSANPSFAAALEQEYSFQNQNIFNHIPHAGQSSLVTQALAPVFEKMVSRYNSCNNQYPFGGEGGELFNPAFCSCLGNYSANDGLEDFLKNLLGLTDSELNYFLSNQELAQKIIQFTNEKNYDDASKLAGKKILNLIMNGWLEGPYSEEQREEIIESYGFPSPEYYYDFIIWCKTLKKQWDIQHPSESCGTLCWASIALEAHWNAITEQAHTLLDICGLLPGVGEPCDGLNGVLYLIEGDGINATISFAATLPIAGWAATGAKYVHIAVNTAAGLKKLKISKVGNVLEFSHYSSFRSILGVTDPNKHAHHLIPWGKRYEDAVQKAAQAPNQPFHMNNPNNNGIAIESWRNQPNHSAYDTKVQGVLDYIKGNYASSSPDEASEVLKNFQDYLKQQIEDHPNLHLNDVPISWP